jgi:hypothetical protein
MVKFFVSALISISFSVFAINGIILAQVAVEYGVLGSKTGTAVATGSGRTSCLSNTCRSKPVFKSSTVRKNNEPRVVEKWQERRDPGTGPLIIERRGDHYEQIR